MAGSARRPKLIPITGDREKSILQAIEKLKMASLQGKMQWGDSKHMPVGVEVAAIEGVPQAVFQVESDGEEQHFVATASVHVAIHTGNKSEGVVSESLPSIVYGVMRGGGKASVIERIEVDDSSLREE